MKFTKLLAVVLCAFLALSGVAALAEEDKDARIAELEAEVERLEEYRRMCIVAEFDGGEVLLKDAQAQYEYIRNMYAQYGVTLEGTEYESTVKADLIDSLAEDEIVMKMAETLGLDQIDEETMAQFKQTASENFESNVSFYATNYFAENYETEEEAIAAATDYLNEAGYGYDAMLESTIQNHIRDAVYNYVVKDVALDEADVTAYYDNQLAADEANYKDSPYNYEAARGSGSLITWNPEGYRQVKHILFAFDEDQSTRYSELTSTLESLEAELVAATTPAEATEAPAVEHDHDGDGVPDHDVDSAEAQAEETASATTPPRDASEIQADIDQVNADIDALYEELTPRVEAAVARFEAGEDIDALIGELGEDPGMQQEPALTNGYSVAANSEYYDPAFTEGAMSIAEVGQISEPVRGSYGIHVIYYLSDVPAGAVALENLREDIEALALEEKIASTYTDQIAAWKTEMNLVLYPENL